MNTVDNDSIWETRALILSQLPDDEAAELRARWRSDSIDPMRGGSISICEDKMSTGTKFFIEQIDEECENIERAAVTARTTAESTKATALKSAEKSLALQFAKLLDKEVAIIREGELRFALPTSDYSYSVSCVDGQFMLNVNGTPFEKFASNGDAIRSLAKILAKNPQPKPIVAPVAEVSAETKLRESIKRFVSAFEELKRVSQ